MLENLKEFIGWDRKEVRWMTVIAGLVFAVFIFVTTVIEGEAYIPPNFAEAREAAIDISRDIVMLANQSGSSLSRIAARDSIGDYQGALNIAQKELGRLERMEGSTARLSESFLEMLKTLDEVEPKRARDAGKEAIVVGIRTVEHLVAYGDLNDQLLSAIEQKLGGEDMGNEIQDLVERINEEVRIINGLNEHYQSLIQQFDALTARR